MDDTNRLPPCLVIDQEFCRKSTMANDDWGRQGVTPFAVAAYVYHAIHTLKKTPAEVIDAVVMTKWDSLFWQGSGISIGTWNRLFNGLALTDDDWDRIIFPLTYINEVYTNVTASTRKHKCHPMFFGNGTLVSDFLVCTEEAFQKALVDKSSVKVTAYRYGLASDIKDVLQGLREETTRVVLPLRF